MSELVTEFEGLNLDISQYEGNEAASVTAEAAVAEPADGELKLPNGDINGVNSADPGSAEVDKDNDIEGKLFIGGISWQTTEEGLRCVHELASAVLVIYDACSIVVMCCRRMLMRLLTLRMRAVCTVAFRSYYFGKFGTLADVALMKDKYTGQPRGFGFIKFEDPAVLDAVLAQVRCSADTT
jgi:RNA recognition motif-containing protein